ncbi:hypothetical protein LPJ72_002422 [Coemansia sp. Benny D160-2]|nr:hypothetical protein LPJ72_002422 [Coemansia sp. Benny D160-2]
MGSTRLDVITGRMSKLMLKRWSMLAEMCTIDGCSSPLMRDPATGDTKCVWHDGRELFPDELTQEEDDDDKEEESNIVAVGEETGEAKDTADTTDEKMDTHAVDRPEKEEETAAPTSDDSLDAVFPDDDEAEHTRRIRRERREQDDRAGQLIAKRMLQGWRMIDRPCPNKACRSVPLVQDKEKMQFCVVCEQRYMDETDYVQKYGSLDQNKLHHTSEEALPKAPEIVAPPEKPELKAKDKKQRQGQPGTNPGTTSSTIPATQEAIDALNAKIADLSARLAKTTRLKDIVRITKAIASCAKAIRHCQKLSSI